MAAQGWSVLPVLPILPMLPVLTVLPVLPMLLVLPVLPVLLVLPILPVLSVLPVLPVPTGLCRSPRQSCGPAAAQNTLGLHGRKNLPLPHAITFALIAFCWFFWLLLAVFLSG